MAYSCNPYAESYLPCELIPHAAGPLTMELDNNMVVVKISAGGMAAKAGISIGMRLMKFQRWEPTGPGWSNGFQ